MSVPPFEIVSGISAPSVTASVPALAMVSAPLSAAVSPLIRSTQAGSQASDTTPGRSQQVAVTVPAVRAASGQIEAFLRSQDHPLELRVEGAGREISVSVVDPESGKVLRQFPGEAALALAQLLAAEKNMGGNLLFDGQG
jgi:uncharacterized FlaG/YvyC family protein